MKKRFVEWIGYFSKTRDPIIFTKDGGWRSIIEGSDNESLAALHLSTMRGHRVKFTAECLPEEKDNLAIESIKYRGGE